MRYVQYLTFLFLGVSVLFFCACDTIDQPFPKVRPRSFIDTLALDSVEAKTTFGPPTQKVLLEDYTGHQCGNCPAAATKAKDLQNAYGEKLVVMALHVGWFARTNASGKYSYDFKTETGNDFDAYFKPSDLGLPRGMVNRITPQGTNSPVLHHDTWSTHISGRINNAPKMDLQMVNYYKPSTRVINTKVTAKALQALPGNYKIGVYLVEDSIVNWQKEYNPAPGRDIENYVHRHVLRTAITNTWGDSLNINPVAAGKTFVSYYGYTLDPTWKAKDCSVIVFIYDVFSKEIIQVEERHIEVK